MSVLLPRELREERCPYCEAVRLHLRSHIAHMHPTRFTAWDRRRRTFHPSIFAQLPNERAREKRRLARERSRDVLEHPVCRFA